MSAMGGRHESWRGQGIAVRRRKSETMHTYRVKFSEKYTGIREWMDGDPLVVVANGDGQKAINKARKLALSREFEDGDGSMRRCTSVRVIGLEQLSEIDG